MDKLIKKVELFSNIAIIIVAILLGAVLVKKYFLTQPIQHGSNATVKNLIVAGTKINIQGIDWSKHEQTLVLALSNSCHFCSESAPFYRRFVQSKGRTGLSAVLPQSVKDGQKYLERLGVDIGEVKKTPLANLGVDGTSTLILVDSKGAVIDSWIGELSADKETEVLARLEQRR